MIQQTDPKLAWHITSFTWKLDFSNLEGGEIEYHACKEFVIKIKWYFVQFGIIYLYNLKKVKKTLMEEFIATLLKIKLLHGCFLPFLNWTNDTNHAKHHIYFKNN